MAHRELNSGLRSRSLGLTEVLGFLRASRNMAAGTPCNASGEDDHGGGDLQQILRNCAESLLTAVARLEGGERSLTDPTQTPSKALPLWNLYFHSPAVNTTSIVFQG